MAKQTSETAMLEAENWLRARGVRYATHPPHHLKVGEVNYYPRAGTIFVDEERESRRERGLDALSEILRRLGYLPPDSLE